MLVRVLEYPHDIKKNDNYLRHPVSSNSVFHYEYVNHAGVGVLIQKKLRKKLKFV